MGLMGGASCPIVDNGVLNVPICKTPKTVPGLSGVKEIAMDGSRACVRLATGQVKCWGYRGDWRDSSWEWINRAQLDQTPVTIPGVSTAVGVASGDDHACALLADTTLRCWGNGHSGQLGNGVFGYSTIAVPVAGF
jgi:alpha-tubulin suppressor-like RCC1 family protein